MFFKLAIDLNVIVMNNRPASTFLAINIVHCWSKEN